jgi:hypothetical protein
MGFLLLEISWAAIDFGYMGRPNIIFIQQSRAEK